jgi:Domain of unknown function (DUF4386)
VWCRVIGSFRAAAGLTVYRDLRQPRPVPAAGTGTPAELTSSLGSTAGLTTTSAGLIQSQAVRPYLPGAPRVLLTMYSRESGDTRGVADHEERSRMNGRVVARIAGTLFIVADIAGVLSVFAWGHQQDSGYLGDAAEYSNSITTGAVLVLIMALAVAMIPVVMFPVLKERNEVLALGYVVLRTMEALILLVGAAVALLVLRLSRDYAEAGVAGAADFRALGKSLLAVDNWVIPLGHIIWSLGFLALYYVLYQSRLIPRFISGWGIIGAILCLAGTLLVMYDVGSPLLVVANVFLGSMAANELVLAIWLVVKGFSSSPTSRPSP